MEELSFLKHISIAGASTEEIAAECCSEDRSVLDLDYFIKTVSGMNAKGVRPDIIGSFITTYASKWLPELSDDHATNPTPLICHESPQSLSANWMKKRFIVESLVGILPLEKDCVSCDFLLRLLRCGNMVGLLDPTCQIELENRISQQLSQASLKELMIPSFSSHTSCETVLNIELVIRLVIRFTNLDGMNNSATALVKVGKLVDSYLVEAATDPNLTFSQFIALAAALPGHARATHDGLYQAMDTYLKVNKRASKKERKSLWRLIDVRKLSSNASVHAVQNERLPARAVIQVVYSEHARINLQSELSASSIGTTSLNPVLEHSSSTFFSRNVHLKELKKLREDVHKLQLQYYCIQVQMETFMEKKKKGLFKWKKLRVGSLQPVNKTESADRSAVTTDVGFDFEQHYAPTSTTNGNPRFRRKSMS